MSIPNEAVTTAAERMYERSAARRITGDTWAEIEGGTRDGWLLDATAALEAAAPHMLAGAWDAGHSAGDGDQSAMWDARNSGKPVKYADVVTPNPYRPTK